MDCTPASCEWTDSIPSKIVCKLQVRSHPCQASKGKHETSSSHHAHRWNCMRRSPGTYHNWFDPQVRQATLVSPTHGINDHKFSERSLVYVNWRSPVARVLSASRKASIDPYQNLGLNQSLPFLHVLLSARPFQAQRYARGTHISSWSDRHTDKQAGIALHTCESLGSGCTRAERTRNTRAAG